MTVKAQLKVVLMANDVVVAESDDAVLWQQILQRLQAPQPGIGAALEGTPADASTRGKENVGERGSEEAVAEFANMLGVPADVVQGACGPTMTSPFLHLNHHHWEALKRVTPHRGPGGVPPATLAATLLTLWCRAAKLPNPTKSDIGGVLASIELQDKNPDRALKNCEWLQLRGSQIMLNPAAISKALVLASAYCLKEAPKRRDED
jgi:hypothetical protein